MVSAEQFLGILAEKDLLPSDVLESLRKLVVQSDSSLSAGWVAKRLIDMGILSRAVAQRLLDKAETETGGGGVEEPDRGRSAARAQADPDVLELVPLEDLEPASPKPSHSPKPAAMPIKSPPKPAAKPAPPQGAWPAAPSPAPPRPAAQSIPTATRSLLEDELSPPPATEPRAMGPLDRLMGGGVMGTAAGQRTVPGPLEAPSAARRRRRKNIWDSPLLLIGGGALLLLVIIGLALFFSVSRQNADEMFQAAESDYRAGSYAQAIEKYNAYLQKFPKHSGASTARVRCGVAHLRQATEGVSDFRGAIPVAEEVIDQIISEDEYGNQGRPELISILPAIAQGLANQARKGPDRAELVQNAREALTLVERYVPRSEQPVSKIADIQASLALTERDLAQDADLVKAIGEIAEAVKQGKVAETYKIRGSLVKRYPALIDNPKLAEAVVAVSQAEQASVKMVSGTRAAVSGEPQSPVLASAVLVRRLNENTLPDAAGQVIYVLGDGAVYALDGATGKALWRRAVGFPTSGHSPRLPPMPVSSLPGSDALLVDTSRYELLRVEGATGRLRWRQALGERFDTQPVIAQDRLLVAMRSGKLVLVDLDSGSSSAYVQLPQELRVSPAVDLRRGLVYQVSEHSNLYVLGLADGLCRQVIYLGHDPGAVSAAPAVVAHLVILAVNDSAEDATLWVLAAQAKAGDPPLKVLQRLRVKGHVDTSPIVVESRVLLTTDRGEINIFDIRGGNAQQPLTAVAQRRVGGEENLIRFPLMQSGQLWVADSQLTRYDFHASRGELQPKWVACERSVALQPLATAGQTVTMVRRRTGWPGVTVTAVSMDEGQAIWETYLGAPLASEPIAQPESGRITAITSAGGVYRIDAAGMKGTSILDPPAASMNPAELKSPVRCAGLQQGMLAFASPGAKRIASLDLRAEKDALRMLLLPDPLGSLPWPLAGGIVAPLSTGQVLLLDPRTGAGAAEPFLPRLESGAKLEWRDGDDFQGREYLLADGHTRIYRLGIKPEPKPHLAALSEIEVSRPIVTPVAVVGAAVYAADDRGTLMGFQLPGLTRGEKWTLDGHCAWGPRRAGKNVLLATDSNQLYCLNDKQKLLWKVDLPAGPLAGRPLEIEGGYLLASSGGLLWRADAATGRELARLEIGQPLGSGPVLVGDRVFVGAHDGTLFQVSRP